MGSLSDPPGEGEILGVEPPAETCNCLFKWFTRWQHRSAISPVTKLLWCLLCFYFARLFVRSSVSVFRRSCCFRDISAVSCWIFTQLLPLVRLGTDINCLGFGLKKWKVNSPSGGGIQSSTALRRVLTVRLNSRLNQLLQKFKNLPVFDEVIVMTELRQLLFNAPCV